MPTQYPKEFKLKTVARYERGEAISAICQNINISQGTLYRWIKEYRSIHMPQRIYTPAELDALSRKLKKLEHILEVIRLSKCLDEIPLQKKLNILSQLHEEYEQYSVYELCEALDVARGTFYNHIFSRADRSKQIAEHEQLMIQVKQVFDDNAQRFGAEKIRVILMQNGVNVSKKRVSSIMQELGLQSIRSDAKKEYKKRRNT